MGVRASVEQAEQMPDEIRLHELSSEEPEVMPFSPEEEITEEDWEIIYNNVSKLLEEGRADFHTFDPWCFLGYKIKCLSWIAPEKNALLANRTEIFQGLLKKALGWADDGKIAIAHDYAATAKLLCPEKEAALNVRLKQIKSKPRASEQLEIRIEKFQDETLVPNFSYDDYESLVNMKIVNPEAFNKIHLPDKHWERIRDELEEAQREENWFGYGRAAFVAKILFPEKSRQFVLKAKELGSLRGVIEQSRQEFLSSKSKDPQTFLFHVAYAKFALADSIRITDRGIETTPHQYVTFKKDEPRPERRKF